MKYLPSIISAFAISFGLGVFVAHAQGYTPLAPLPGTITPGGSTTNLSSYLSGMLKLLIAVGGALSILMAIIAGTKYVAAGISPDAKSSAKSDLENAFIGLALILSSYMILNSINPKLVAFNLMLDPITPKALETFEQVITLPLPLNAEEDSLRQNLLAKGIRINNSFACQGMTFQDYRAKYDRGCTTIEGLPMAAINGVIALKQSCTACGFLSITGGTEAGHQTHGVGIANLDLALDGSLNGYITNNNPMLPTPAKCGISTAPHFVRDGATYVLEESSHWHVCY